VLFTELYNQYSEIRRSCESLEGPRRRQPECVTHQMTIPQSLRRGRRGVCTLRLDQNLSSYPSRSDVAMGHCGLQRGGGAVTEGTLQIPEDRAADFPADTADEFQSARVESCMTREALSYLRKPRAHTDSRSKPWHSTALTFR